MPDRSVSGPLRWVGPTVSLMTGLFVSTAMFFTLPIFLSAAGESFSLGEAQQGLLAAMDMAGITVAGLLAVWWIRRLRWRRVGWTAQLLLATSNAACIGVNDFEALCVLRFFAGLSAGMLFSVALASGGRQPDPARALSIAIVGQLLLAALGLVLVADAVARWGFDGVLYYLIAVALVFLPGLRSLPDETGMDAASAMESADGETRRIRWQGLAAIGSVVALLTGVSGVWGFAAQIGSERGLGSDTIAATLSASLVASALGPVVSAWIGQSLGLLRPIFLGSAATAACIALLRIGVWPDYAGQYVFAVLGFQISWNFLYPFVLAAVAYTDSQGRLMASSAAAQSGGSTLGPFLGGVMVQSGSPGMLVSFGVAGVVFCFLLILPAILVRQRELRELSLVASPGSG